jgi:hypothetical protein
VALREEQGETHAENLPQEEIGLRLFEIPAFQAFTRGIERRMAEGMNREAGR